MVAGLAVAVLACAAGIAAAQDKQEACASLMSLEDVLNCEVARLQPRPSDKESGGACASLDSLRFVRPAAGPRVLSFGERTQFGGQSKGVVIETRHGEMVASPTDGWVIYAGEFRSYGKLLVLEVGCGLRFVVAGAAKIDVVPGQYVLAGEPVAVMGSGDNSSSAPVLYVELRREGEAIDPGPEIGGQ